MKISFGVKLGAWYFTNTNIFEEKERQKNKIMKAKGLIKSIILGILGLIKSIILGILVSTAIFTILITIKMSSIDYTIANSQHSFAILGQKYLQVTVENHEVTQQVLSEPMAIVSMVASGVIYAFYIFVIMRKKSALKEEKTFKLENEGSE
ncbi:MAG: LlsX family protein [Breznakia sp.]